jgi:hypothetical protein
MSNEDFQAILALEKSHEIDKECYSIAYEELVQRLCSKCEFYCQRYSFSPVSDYVLELYQKCAVPSSDT